MTIISQWTSPASGGTMDIGVGSALTAAAWQGAVGNFLHLAGTGGAARITNYSAAADASGTCTTAFTNVSGATITLTTAGTHLVMGVANISVDNTAGAGDCSGLVQLLCGGTAQSGTINVYANNSVRNIMTAAQNWIVVAATANTGVGMQKKKNQDRGVVTVYAIDTTLTAIRLS